MLKRILPFLSGLILGAIVFGACGAFFGYSFAITNQPAVVLLNTTAVAIPNLRVETDVGESYSVVDLPPRKSRRIQIAGREKLVWIVATTPSGETLTSDKVYVTSQGIIFAVISEQAITIDYEL
jgi:hypothetical protein